MPVSVVVGGQFGSEGKGKVAHWLARESNAAAVVRIGGPNSGHTVVNEDGDRVIFRHLPTAAILPDVICIVGPGSYIQTDLLLLEIERCRLAPDRVLVDPNAMLISESDIHNEMTKGLREHIGSTASGTGEAVIRRISRQSSVRLARDEGRLHPFVRPTLPFMRELLGNQSRIIIEGTQGFGLSLLHSLYYPYATSRDTTAAAFASEAGLSPLDIDEVVLVARAFPIRVAGNSGPLPNEVTWGDVTRISGSTDRLVEQTSVTQRIRRVATFDAAVVKKAIMVNQPTRIVLNHLDYVDSKGFCHGELSEKISDFLQFVQSSINRRIDQIGFDAKSLIENPIMQEYEPGRLGE